MDEVSRDSVSCDLESEIDKLMQTINESIQEEFEDSDLNLGADTVSLSSEVDISPFHEQLTNETNSKYIDHYVTVPSLHLANGSKLKEAADTTDGYSSDISGETLQLDVSNALFSSETEQGPAGEAIEEDRRKYDEPLNKNEYISPGAQEKPKLHLVKEENNNAIIKSDCDISSFVVCEPSVIQHEKTNATFNSIIQKERDSKEGTNENSLPLKKVECVEDNIKITFVHNSEQNQLAESKPEENLHTIIDKVHHNRDETLFPDVPSELPSITVTIARPPSRSSKTKNGLEFYVSDDPRENADNANPDWESLRNLKTDDERYRVIRGKWNQGIPDPDNDLTSFGNRNRKRVSESANNHVSKKRNCSEAFVYYEGVGQPPLKRLCTRTGDDLFRRKILELEEDYKTKKMVALESQKVRINTILQEREEALFQVRQRQRGWNSPFPSFEEQQIDAHCTRRLSYERMDLDKRMFALNSKFFKESSTLQRALKEVIIFEKFYKGPNERNSFFSEELVHIHHEIQDMYLKYEHFY